MWVEPSGSVKDLFRVNPRDIPVLTHSLQPRIKEVPEPQVDGKRTNSLLPKIEFRPTRPKPPHALQGGALSEQPTEGAGAALQATEPLLVDDLDDLIDLVSS